MSKNPSKTPTSELLAAQDQFLSMKLRLPLEHWTEDLREGARRLALELAARHEVPFFPPIVYIEPTNACNCNCVICPRQNMTRPIGTINLDLFRRIVDDLAALGPAEVRLFNFGEPLLHSRLPDLVRLCRERKLPVRFQTNGLLLKETVLNALLESGLDYLGVSVNGLDEADYALIRPGFKLVDLVENIRRARVIAEASGKPLHIHVNAQVIKDNSEERQAQIQLFRKTWAGLADSMSISGLSRYDHVAIVQRGAVSEQQLAQLQRKKNNEVHCEEPFDRLIVKWDGRVTVCCADFDARMVVGDLSRQGFSEIWTGPEMSRIRALILAGAYDDLELCRTCPKFYSDEFTTVFTRSKASAPKAERQ